MFAIGIVLRPSSGRENVEYGQTSNANDKTVACVTKKFLAMFTISINYDFDNKLCLFASCPICTEF